jgi:hypothetical protein
LHKAHIYFYSPIPFPQKVADTVIGLEVKSKGEHGTMFVSSSTHENGFNYEIIGPAREPLLLSSENAMEMMNHIDYICTKHGLEYLQSERNQILTDPLKKIIKSLKIDTDFQYKIPEGMRNTTLLSFADSLLINHRNNKNKSKDELKSFLIKVNEKVCTTPLPQSEINSIWRSAVEWVESLDLHNSSINEFGNGHDKKTILSSSKKEDDVDEEKQDKIKEIFTQKYAGKDYLAEAVFIGNQPCFAVSQKVNDPNNFPSIILVDKIPLDEQTVLKPPEEMSYLNKPYSFESKEEFYEYIENIKNNEDLYSLFKQVKSIWKKYVDADGFHISICAADTIFSYLQDKIGLTHYLFFIGNNGSGKSNNLVLFHYLGYRNMMSTDVTPANIYQYLGSLQEGMGTLCEDEADNLDINTDKMRIYKNGYASGFPVFRMDTTFGRKQYRFFTYCIKAFAAEKTPDSVKGKGFNQRIIELHCSPGFPQFDISEVINPAGEEEHEKLLSELLETRKKLLVYRLLHFHDKIPDIKLNIENREKQLFKPIVRIFQNSQEVLDELLPVISNYVSQKRESNADTLTARIYQLIKTMIQEISSAELESSKIWEKVKKELNGEDIKAQTIQTPDFGPISQKEIIKILKDMFKAKPSKRHDKPRSWVLDNDVIKKLGNVYDLDIEVKVETTTNKKDKEKSDASDASDASTDSIGMEKYIQEMEKTEND